MVQARPLVLTPSQARDLVDHFGSWRAAARVAGMSHSGLRYQLDPAFAARKRAERRQRWNDLTGVQYSRELLQSRRRKALIRRRNRSIPHEED